MWTVNPDQGGLYQGGKNQGDKNQAGFKPFHSQDQKARDVCSQAAGCTDKSIRLDTKVVYTKQVKTKVAEGQDDTEKT